jgi:hypothetical protein
MNNESFLDTNITTNNAFIQFYVKFALTFLVALILCSSISLLHSFEKLIKFILEKLGYDDIHKKNIKPGHYTRQVNIISTIITGILASMAIHEHIFNYIPATCEYIRTYDVNKQFWPIALVVTYFAYDAIHHKLSKGHYFHHGVGFITGLSLFLLKNSFGIYFSSAMMIMEASSVPMNLSYVVAPKHKKIVQIIFALVFTLVRPFYMSILLWRMSYCPPQTMIECMAVVAYLGIYILNMYWFVLICKKFYVEIFSNSPKPYNAKSLPGSNTFPSGNKID